MAGPRRGPGRIPEKPKNFKGTITKLFRCLGRYRLPLVLVLVLALASTAFGIVGPKILSTATTELATGLGRKLSGLGGIDFGKIGKILLTVLALYLVSAACSFFQSWILAGITQKLAYRLRGEISAKIHRMPMRYFERNTVGDVLSRITNDVDTMSSGMAQSVTQLVTNVTMLVGVLVMMLRISWLMTLIALIVLPVTGVLTGRIVKRSQRYFVAQQKNLGDINGKVEETYAGHNVVCAFNREGATQKEFDAINARLYRSAWKSQFLSGLMSPVTTFVSKLGYVCVVVLGGSLAARGTITIGDIQAFLNYMANFTQPITQLAQISTQLQTMAAAAERVFAFLDEVEEPADPALPAPAEHIRGDVSFRHVRFGYDPAQPVIHDWSCDVPAGRTVAIVGPTAPARPRWSSCSCAFTMSTPARSSSTGATCATMRAATCGAPSAWCCRTRGSLRARSWKTSATAAPRRRTPRSSRRQRPRAPTPSSARCPAATRWSSTRRRRTSPRGKSSC